MKLYIHTDIEGVAGMVHFEDREDQTAEGYFRRLRLHRLLTGEVNAAIEGALDAGVDEILVNDAHGSGYNILFEELNPAAQIIHGPLTRQPFWMPCMDESIDLCFCIAQHAMDNSNGVLAHSAWYCNDYYFGEAGMAMVIAGCYDVPTVLVTGDDTCCAQVRELVPELETVVVKEALSPYNAKSWTPARAREMIRDSARRAVQRRGEIPPFSIKGPYRLGHPPRPGVPPSEVTEGEDFIALVTEVLNRLYHYDLQRQPIWPMEPGRHLPALPRPLLEKWQEEHGAD